MRLEKQRKDWDRKLDRIRALDLASRNGNGNWTGASRDVTHKGGAGSHMGTTAALGEKVCYLYVLYSAMQCNAMQCNAMQCNAMQCNAMQCNAMQCNAMQCNAMQCNVM